jgi:type IV pilus assembly protein PilW
VNNNRDAFRAGDLVIAVQPGGGAGGGPSCVMQEVTGVPSAANNCNSASGGGSSEIIHNTGQYKNPNSDCQMVTPIHNQSGGITDPATGQKVPALSAANGGTLFDIGALPQVKVYAVRNAILTVCDMMAQDCTQAANYTPMVNGIVSLRAVYGKDTDANGTVETWDRAALGTSAQVMSVLAAAVEVTAMSALKEKPSGGTTCDATTAATNPDKGQTGWFGASYAAGAGIDVSQVPVDDWKCYRYKLFQTSVPLRNMIWRP